MIGEQERIHRQRRGAESFSMHNGLLVPSYLNGHSRMQEPALIRSEIPRVNGNRGDLLALPENNYRPNDQHVRLLTPRDYKQYRPEEDLGQVPLVAQKSNGHRLDIYVPERFRSQNGAKEKAASDREVVLFEAPEYEEMHAKERYRPNGIAIAVAHADDEVEFTTGIARAYLRQGIPVYFIVLSDGRKGTGPYTDIRPMNEEALVFKRKVELKYAVEKVNEGMPIKAQVVQPPLPFRDGELSQNGQAMTDFLLEVLDATGADMLLAHPREDYHWDHIAVAEAAYRAASKREIALYEIDKQFGKEWQLPEGAKLDANGKPQKGYTLERFFKEIKEDGVYVPSNLLWVPDEDIEVKVEALKQHISQMWGTNYIDRIVDSNRLRGGWIRKRFAEAYKQRLRGKYGPKDEDPMAASLPDGSMFQIKTKRRGEENGKVMSF